MFTVYNHCSTNNDYLKYEYPTKTTDYNIRDDIAATII